MVLEYVFMIKVSVMIVTIAPMIIFTKKRRKKISKS